jgi:hypothetical protein
MKRCRNITCWTDYPFESLGDAPGKDAPVRHVRVVSFDGNKYAKVAFGEHVEFIKTGYLYSKRGRYGTVKQISFRKLERMIPLDFERMIRK